MGSFQSIYKEECCICYNSAKLQKYPTCEYHEFCKKCIAEWKSQNNNNGSCPICRKK